MLKSLAPLLLGRCLAMDFGQHGTYHNLLLDGGVRNGKGSQVAHGEVFDGSEVLGGLDPLQGLTKYLSKEADVTSFLMRTNGRNPLIEKRGGA